MVGCLYSTAGRDGSDASASAGADGCDSQHRDHGTQWCHGGYKSAHGSHLPSLERPARCHHNHDADRKPESTGTGTARDVIATAEKDRSINAEAFANFYIALYHECARTHQTTAERFFAAAAAYPSDDFMGRVMRHHVDNLSTGAHRGEVPRGRLGGEICPGR